MKIPIHIALLARHLLCLLVTFTLLTSKGVTEAPISVVRVGVQYSDSSAVVNLKLSLKNTTGSAFLCTTDSTGMCYFANVAPGSYQLATELNSSTLLANSATYQKVFLPINVQRSDINYNASVDTLSIQSITLAQYPRILTFQTLLSGTSSLLTSPPSNSTPIAGTNLFFSSPDGRQVSVKADNTGVVRVGFQSNDTNNYPLTLSNEGYRPAVFNISPATLPTLSYVGLQPTNACLTIQLVDSQGNSRPLASTESGWVSCYSQNGVQGGYSKPFVTGTSSLQLPIGDGSYRCRTGISGFMDYSFEATILAGETKPVTVPLRVPDSFVRINFQTPDGLSYSIPTSDRFVLCTSTDGTYSRTYPIPGGASYVDLTLVSGEYSCKTDLAGVTTSDAKIVALSSYSTDGRIVVTVPDATLTVSLNSSTSSNPLPAPASNQVQVICSNTADQKSFFRFFTQRGCRPLQLDCLREPIHAESPFPAMRATP